MPIQLKMGDFHWSTKMRAFIYREYLLLDNAYEAEQKITIAINIPFVSEYHKFSTYDRF